MPRSRIKTRTQILRHETVEGNSAITIGADQSTSVGRDLALKAGRNADQSISQDLSIAAGKKIVIKAGDH